MQQLKKLFSVENLKAKTLGAATLGSSMMVVAAPASAAIPPEATAAFTTLTTDVTAMLALVWPVVALVVVGFALIKLFKRGANKAV